MNKTLLMAAFCSVTNLLTAQVGINTQQPKGIFHVDPKSDTNSSGINSSDDVLVDTEGRMGIGTITPQEKLHVMGNSITYGNAESQTITAKTNALVKNKIAAGNGTPPAAALEVVIPAGSTDKDIFFIEHDVPTDLHEDKLILTSEASGRAHFAYIRPKSKIVGMNEATGVLDILCNNDIVISDKSDFINITKKPLRLGVGKWLLIASYGARRKTTSAPQTKSLAWIQLRRTAAGAPESTSERLSRYGYRPEHSGLKVVTPRLTQVVSVPEESDFYIYAYIEHELSSDPENEYITSDWFGESFFCAIFLDEHP